MSNKSDSQFLVDLAWEMEKAARKAGKTLAIARKLSEIGNRIGGQSGTLVPTCVAKELIRRRSGL